MGKSKDLATGETRFVNTAGDTMTGSLEVEGSTTDAIAIKYTGTSGGHNSKYLFKDFRGQINAAIYNNLQNDGVGSEAASIEFHTANGGTLTKQMDISKQGIVTKPNHPSFYAYTSSDYTSEGELTGGSKWNERWDTGNNFNDGIFTAPVAGKYFFSVMWDAKSIRSTIDIQVNSVSQIRYEPTGLTNDTWETHAYSGSLNLAANDAVRLYGRMHSQSSSNPFHMGGSGQWGHFSGFLVG